MSSASFSRSAADTVLPRTRSIFIFIMPDALLSICRKASYSPCISLKKYSVPLGRLRIAERLIISLAALSIVGYSLARSLRYFMSILSLRSGKCMFTVNYITDGEEKQSSHIIKRRLPYGKRPRNRYIKTKKRFSFLNRSLVRVMGLEPIRLSTHAPQTCLSAYSSTLAFRDCFNIISDIEALVKLFLKKISDFFS